MASNIGIIKKQEEADKMRELIKKSLLIGIGAASVTKSRAQKLLKAFVRKKAISSGEAKAIARAVLKEASRQNARLRQFGKAKGSILGKKAARISNELERLGKAQARKVLKMAEKRLK